METRSNNVLVGAVVLALLAALAVFIVWLAGNTKGNVKPYDIFFTQSVDGLAKGGAVSFSGVPSGQITEIELWKNDPQFVRVRIEVKNDTPVLRVAADALTAWLKASGITEGRIFRRVRKGGHRSEALSPAAVRDIVKHSQ